MERRVIKMGESSLVVSLPKRWVEKAKIKRGASVEVEELPSGELVVKPKTIMAEKKVVKIDISTTPLEKTLIDSYVNGADVIIASSEKLFEPEIVDKVYKICAELQGMEITEVNSRKIVIEYYGGVLPAKKLLSRFSLIITNYLQSAAETFKDAHSGYIGVVKKIREANRVYYALLRSLVTAASNLKAASEMGLESREPLFYILLTNNFREIAKSIEETEYYETKYNQRVAYFFERALEMHKKLMKALSKKDYKAATEAMAKVDDVLKEIYPERQKIESEMLKTEERRLFIHDCKVPSLVERMKGMMAPDPTYIQNLLKTLQAILQFTKENFEIVAMNCA